MSLLQLLAQNQNNLDDLTAFRVRGNDNLASGIGAIFSDTISAVAHGGSGIIRSIGHGLRDGLDGVGDFDEKVILSIGNATSADDDTP